MTVNPQKHRQRQSLTGIAGFTLIEMVAGVVVLAVALSSLTIIFYPQATNSVDPIYQVRAAELGHSLLNQILGKNFDENANSGGVLIRCDETPAVLCSVKANFGINQDATENSVDKFDDVDDYDGYSTSPYAGYSVIVTVIYDGDYNGVEDTNHAAKRIAVTVTMPDGESVSFASYRGNY